MKLPSKLSVMLAGSAMVAGTAVATLVPQEAHAASCIYYVYSYGSSGGCVKNIQLMANAITHNWGGGLACSGYNNGVPQRMSTNYIAADGAFGPITKAKVKDIQRAIGCDTVDGIVGRETWSTLCFYAASKVNNTSSIYNAGYVAALNSGCKPSDSYTGPWPYTPY